MAPPTEKVGEAPPLLDGLPRGRHRTGQPETPHADSVAVLRASASPTEHRRCGPRTTRWRRRHAGRDRLPRRAYRVRKACPAARRRRKRHQDRGEVSKPHVARVSLCASSNDPRAGLLSCRETERPATTIIPTPRRCQRLTKRAVLETVRRCFAFVGADVERAEEIYHEDAVLEFPQSGERFEGVATFTEWRQQSRRPRRCATLATGHRCARPGLLSSCRPATTTALPGCRVSSCWSFARTRWAGTDLCDGAAGRLPSGACLARSDAG